MPDGNWKLRPVTIVLTTIAIMLLAAREQHVVPTSDLPFVPPPSEVAYQEAQPSSEQTQEQADLEAQQSMASAAWATTYATWIAVGISFCALIGLIATVVYARYAWKAAADSAKADNDALELTRTQLRESREAAAEARETTQAQARCYVEALSASYTPQKPGQLTLLQTPSGIDIKATNRGGTLAMNVTCFCEAVMYNIDTESGFRWKEVEKPLRMRVGNIAPGTDFSISLASPLVDFVEGAETDGSSCAVLRGAIYYTDVFGSKFRTGFMFPQFIPVKKVLVREGPFSIGKAVYHPGTPYFEPVEKYYDE